MFGAERGIRYRGRSEPGKPAVSPFPRSAASPIPDERRNWPRENRMTCILAPLLQLIACRCSGPKRNVSRATVSACSRCGSLRSTRPDDSKPRAADRVVRVLGRSEMLDRHGVADRVPPDVALALDAVDDLLVCEVAGQDDRMRIVHEDRIGERAADQAPAIQQGALRVHVAAVGDQRPRVLDGARRVGHHLVAAVLHAPCERGAARQRLEVPVLSARARPVPVVDPGEPLGALGGDFPNGGLRDRQVSELARIAVRSDHQASGYE